MTLTARFSLVPPRVSLVRDPFELSVAGSQYTLRRTATPRGATTAPAGRTTGAATTTAPPPAATQPARTTPRAQTTAFASIVLKAMTLPASNSSVI
jgi:hypothetical protein